MGSQSALRLPIIDFSELEQDSSKWDLLKIQVLEALEEYGCFEALFPKISTDLKKALFVSLEELFNLPLETKSRNKSQKLFHGYIGHNPIVPLYESMGIDEVLTSEKLEAFTNLLWPQGNPAFCDTIQSFSEQLSELDQIIRKMILDSLGLENYLDEHLDSTNYVLRVMKYREPKTTEKELGLSCHTDKNIVSILSQNQVEGLEVQTKDGEWIKATPSADSFIVLIGEALHAWTNGRLYPANHRVMMSGNEARYSTALFSSPKDDYIIKTPDELVDEQHPLLFKQFAYGEFLGSVRSQSGKVAKTNAINAYRVV